LRKFRKRQVLALETLLDGGLSRGAGNIVLDTVVEERGVLRNMLESPDCG
jgi:hypothetical protein